MKGVVFLLEVKKRLMETSFCPIVEADATKRTVIK
jgi:hypothetical protein